MASVGSNVRNRRLAAAALILLAGVFLAHVALGYRTIIVRGLQYDDSFITYRYAANLSEGRGLTFNSYERVGSASSVLYTALLAGANRLGVTNMEHLAAGINIAAGVAALAVALRLCTLISGSPVASCVLLLPVALAGAWPAWAASGMEAVFYAFLVLGVFWSYVMDRRRLFLLLLVACLLSRPEGVLLWLAVLATEWSVGVRPFRLLIPTAVAGAATLALLYSAYTLYYGAWVPQPAVLKSVSSYYSPGVEAQVRSAARFFLGGFAPLVVTAILGSAIRIRQTLSHRATVASDPAARLAVLNVVFLGITIASLLLGPRSDLMRYAIHTLPLLGVAAAAAWPWARIRLDRRAMALACVLFVCTALPQAIQDARRTRSLFIDWSTHQAARKSLGKWLEAHAPKGSLVLSSDVGAIAYEAIDHEFYDMVGLVTVMPLASARDNQWERVGADLVRRKPGYVCDTVLPDGELQALQILRRPSLYFRGVQDPGWYPTFSERTILSIPAGRYRYELRALEWP